MAEVEEAHWWYRALHHRVLDSIRKCFQKDDITILDAGCGTGGLMRFLQGHGYRNISGFDLSPYAVEICRERRLPSVKLGDILKIDEIFQGPFDVIVSNDVLCYFNEREIVSLADKILRRLKPGGVFMGNLPAFKAFGGIHDISVGIKMRYTKKQFLDLFDPESFENISVDFWPFLLSPFVFLVRSVQRIKLRLNPDLEIRSDIDMPNAIVNGLLFRLIALENKVFRKKPWASSMFIILRKKSSPR